jgi:hypothetical protein
MNSCSALWIREISLGLLIHAALGSIAGMGSPRTKVAGFSRKLFEHPRPVDPVVAPRSHSEPRRVFIPSRCDDADGYTWGKTRRRIGAHLGKTEAFGNRGGTS